MASKPTTGNEGTLSKEAGCVIGVALMAGGSELGMITLTVPNRVVGGRKTWAGYRRRPRPSLHDYGVPKISNRSCTPPQNIVVYVKKISFLYVHMV